MRGLCGRHTDERESPYVKLAIIVRDLGAAEWIELPEVIVFTEGWLIRNFKPFRPTHIGGQNPTADDAGGSE